jgi:hypothetical protein
VETWEQSYDKFFGNIKLFVEKKPLTRDVALANGRFSASYPPYSCLQQGSGQGRPQQVFDCSSQVCSQQPGLVASASAPLTGASVVVGVVRLAVATGKSAVSTTPTPASIGLQQSIWSAQQLVFTKKRLTPRAEVAAAATTSILFFIKMS